MQRHSLKQRLLADVRGGQPPPALESQQAFLEGLLQGWFDHSSQGSPLRSPPPSPAEPEDAMTKQSPDLHTWLVGLASGVIIGGIGGLFALVALRSLGLDPLGLAHSPSAAPPASPLAPRGASGSDVAPSLSAFRPTTRFPGLAARCARFAPPAAEQIQLAAPTNFDQRLQLDASGAPIPSQPSLIVLHETVLDLPATIALFQRRSADDAAQGSYHVLIARDGKRVRIVPDDARAYGAGDSGFGDLRFQTSATNPPSINNVALHVSLESPADGRGDAEAHSGYTTAQYRSLAAQVLRWQTLYGIPMERVTTHAAVDRSHSRYDPRSFRWDRFDQEYNPLRRSCA